MTQLPQQTTPYISQKTPMSIRWRLLWSLGLSLPILWFIISVLAALPLYQKISADDDMYLQQLAKALLDERPQSFGELSSDNKRLDDELLDDFELPTPIEAIDELMFSQQFAFAIWDQSGQLLESGGGKKLLYSSNTGNFINTHSRWHSDAWRVYYLTNKQNGKTVAVAQIWRSRLVGMKEIILEQLVILLLTLPLLLIVVVWSVRRGLRPLNQLTTALNQRHAHDLAPIRQAAPEELQPLTVALNQLFNRVSTTVAREQRFTADAAHELRSPLAAIKLQANELAHSLSTDNKNELSHQVLQRIQRVSNRASHLIDQLLTLAQLDNDKTGSTVENTQEKLDWESISNEALQSVNRLARERGVLLKRTIKTDNLQAVLPVCGDATLLTLLLRNLLDNAIRYSGESQQVELILSHDTVAVRDKGKGIATKDLARIRERFFRPAGQLETGSGLGLSIVERIAELHGLEFSLENYPTGGVLAQIKRS